MSAYQPRSAASQAAYTAFRKENNTDFILDRETIIKDFSHWVIIENRFPYDNMTCLNHLLVSKEPISSIHGVQSAIKDEYDSILQSLASSGAYDACIENFPKASTLKSHFHVHLVRWHNTN